MEDECLDTNTWKTYLTTIVLSAILLVGGDGAKTDIRSVPGTAVEYDAGDPIEDPASVDPPVGYANDSFTRGWATFVPTATATATATPDAPGIMPDVVELRPGALVDRGALVSAYPWPLGWARAVIQCESGGDPNAYNPAGPYLGLFQIWIGYGGNLYDPEVNIATAYALYSTGGAGHWPNCP